MTINFASYRKSLWDNPETGDTIKGTGGLRKVRFGDVNRGKGKRGGVRVIYYWYLGGNEFWLFTVYGKDEMDDLSAAQKKALKLMLQNEEKEHGKA